MEKRKNEKPLVCISTYRGIEGYDPGTYKGKQKDVVVLGTSWIEGGIVDKKYKPDIHIDELRDLEAIKQKLKPRIIGGTVTISKKDAKNTYDNSKKQLKSFLDRLEHMYVYLGKDGAGPGFDFIYGLFEEYRINKDKISLVGCDCGLGGKKSFAGKHGLELILCECGGSKTLSRIIKKTLQ
jgi:hypothetical protein